MRRLGSFERSIADLRFGARFLRKNPLFTVVAVLTLALGIGASTAIFSVVDGILLRALPFAQSERLVTVWSDQRERGGPEREWLSYPNFHDARRLEDVFQELGVFAGWGPTFTVDAAGTNRAEALSGAQVTQGLLETVYGVSPMLGRAFVPEDDQPGAPMVALLSERLWVRLFGADRQALGSSITLDGVPHTVVGVLPADFHQPFVTAAEIWSPFRWNETEHFGGRGDAFLRAVGRLSEGVSISEARSALSQLAGQLEAEFPENRDAGFGLYPLKDDLIQNARLPLLVLLSVVGATLLIVCVNLANLLLARGSARRMELSMRAAMGAGRSRIVRQLLTESVLLAGLGGALGVVAAYVGTRWLVAIAPPGTPRIEEVAVNVRVLSFGIAAALLSGILFGLAPAFRGSRVGLAPLLHRDDRGGDGATGLRSGLMVAQIALALVLLVGAGLLLRSFRQLTQVDLGFEPKGIVSFFVPAPPARFEEIEAARAHYLALADSLRAVPGVAAVGAVSALPLAGFDTDVNFQIEGRPLPEPGDQEVAWIRRASPEYFATLGIGVVAGRAIDTRDQKDGPPVVMVNETLAKRFFGSTTAALGQRINVNRASQPVWREIVGVAHDIKNFGLRADSRNAAYFPFDQLPTRGMFLVVRSEGDPESIVPAARQAIGSLDPTAAPSVSLMKDLIRDSLSIDRFLAQLLSLFALVALQLAAVGLYGLVSYSVGRRLREIGLRMALGADRAEVSSWVLRRGLGLSLLGVACGLVGAILLTRWITGLLFEVSPLDPLTLGGVAALMVAVTAAASLVPAWRASRVDPAAVLRAE